MSLQKRLENHVEEEGDIVKEIDGILKNISFPTRFCNRDLERRMLNLGARLVSNRSGGSHAPTSGAEIHKQVSLEILAKPNFDPAIFIFSNETAPGKLIISGSASAPFYIILYRRRNLKMYLDLNLIDFAALLLHPEISKLNDNGEISWHDDMVADFVKTIYKYAEIIKRKGLYRVTKPRDVFGVLTYGTAFFSWNIYIHAEHLDPELLKILARGARNNYLPNNIEWIMINRKAKEIEISFIPSTIIPCLTVPPRVFPEELLRRYLKKIEEAVEETTRRYVLGALSLASYLELDLDS